MAAITRKHSRSDDYLPPCGAVAKRLRRISSIGVDKTVEFVEAVKQSRHDDVRLMLEARVSPNFMHAGRTPLIRAAKKGDYEMAELLLEARADPDAMQSDSDIAFIPIITFDYSRLGKLLFDHHADIHSRACEGITPYVMASYSNNLHKFPFLKPDTYSTHFLAISLLANVSGLEGVVTIEGTTLNPIGHSICLVARHYLRMLEATKMAVSKERIAALQLVVDFPNNKKKIFQRIQTGKITIIPFETHEHTFTLLIQGNSLVICNPGASMKLAKGNLQYMTFDSKAFTYEVMEKILSFRNLDTNLGITYCYKTLLEKLHAVDASAPFHHFVQKAPKDSEWSNCCVASLKAANRAFLFFELPHVTRAGIENAWIQSKRESTLFREYAERHCAEVVGEPQSLDVKSLIQRSKAKRAKRKYY